MKLRSMRLETQPRLMIIPMIDIIFFLLVFFMMSTLYMVEQHTIPVNLPQAAAARQDKPQSVAVTVAQDGRVLFDQEEIPLPLIAERVVAELARDADSTFVLRADKEVEYGKVVAVLDELKIAGARKVAVAAEWKAR